METEPRTRVLTQEQTAELLHQKIRTLGYWRQRNEGPPAYKNGKHISYFEDEVLEWLRGKRIKSDR